MPEYTTTEAAALLETARRNVQNYCKRHGLKKFGREYVVTQADIEAMKLELGKVGRKKSDDTRGNRAAAPAPRAPEESM